ncbi:MAG: heparinase II/III family protein [Candidatus Latescibacterota bacterium]|nr:heparinase II/III family protein [Candidatus Latescibacterota bacterium]
MFVLITIILTSCIFFGQANAQTLPKEKHPSLLFSENDIPQLKDRIKREPYASWWETVLNRADTTPANFTNERSKVRYAKSLAFCWLITENEKYAKRAIELMQIVSFPPRGGDLGEPHNEGEVVAQYAVAYDWLHSYAALKDPEALAEMRDILAEESYRLWRGIVISELDLGLTSLKIRLHETPHIDNWHIRAYGGLGLASIAIADYTGGKKTPQEWSDRAYDMVTRSMNFQIDEIDGGYAEGPFYLRYAADVYLPYFFALKNTMGLNLFSTPKYKKVHEWSLNLRMPNGRRPNIDDGHLDDFYGHYLTTVYEDGGIYRWDWETNENGLYVRQFSEMDAIAFYDDQIPSVTPTHGPSVWMPGAGDAVFRSDWSPDATYMLLRGEHGVARSAGLSHEHPDETSFVIYASGEMLALDAGYINYTNHDKVNEGRNHNVVLIDGQGPPRFTQLGKTSGGGNDAYIRDFFTSEMGDYAEVDASYQGAELKRRVLFADQTYFVIADEIDSKGNTHNFEWRLHGNGGGNSGGTYNRDDNTSVWKRATAELIAYIPQETKYTISEQDTIHSFDYLEEQTHTALQVRQKTADPRYLSVLYPRNLFPKPCCDNKTSSFGIPSFKTAVTSGGTGILIDFDDKKDITWLRAVDANSVKVSNSSKELESDAAFGYTRQTNEHLSSFSLQDGSRLIFNGTCIFESNLPVDAGISLNSALYAGFIRGPESGYTITIPLQKRRIERATFAGHSITPVINDDQATFDLKGQAQLKIVFEKLPITQLHVIATVGRRESISPLRTRVGRTVNFSVFTFTGEDSSDIKKVEDYQWIVPYTLLGDTNATGSLELTTVAGVNDSIGFSYGEAKTSFRVITTPSKIEKVTIDPPNLKIKPGDTQSFRATALDKYGNVIVRNFGWHVVGDIGTIHDRRGDFRAGDNPGEGWIIAVANTQLIFSDVGATVQGAGKIVVESNIPRTYALHPNTPNPFNPSTQITFELPTSGHVELTVYNALGQPVEQLVNRTVEAGFHSVMWESEQNHSGVYFYELRADAFVARRKMLLLR